MHLLHVIGSPRAGRSASQQVARAFTDAWKERHPDGSVDELNVWETDLPTFDGPILEAKYAGIQGRELDAAQASAWRTVHALAERFTKADVIVFSVPMWNFGIPYRLKHLIDVISQKDVLFTFDENGLNGLLGGKTVVTIAARGVQIGGDFPPEEYDFQSDYLKMWSRMVGITDVRVVTVEKTLAGPEQDHASRNDASEKARELALSL
ncbi:MULTISPECIES: NAD(P)H-dependent oxidoreductase [unclassified Caballeronia]|uniref:FMN-dependent NADH-azoreductase n=1 Tax=unclassified Caballeronia TaxID=2646786 RepID=UPI0028577A36|nr:MULTISPECIES: NAD(P)H-dependent oxidoreductase [unclassified Caballeronia]MDR5773287.1 NAD(P)H-dependent oxidoreductase [Caballeronia sp. LZ002]MDR5848721.1 NAD(P)H-dependent oxidoreductase [Caballeronia sp. LZ003]